MSSSSSLEEYIGTVGYIQIVVQGGMVVHISSPYASTLYSQYPLNEIVGYANYIAIGRIAPTI